MKSLQQVQYLYSFKNYMLNLLNKQPNCPYGNHAKFICVNNKCQKPGLICQKGQNSQSQCWLFHYNCNKVKWSQIEALAKQNTNAKSPQFVHLQDKIQNLFLKTLEKIQSQHEKFNIWTRTYGHSLEAMKFIKVLLDRNYDQLTGQYMASMMPAIFSKQLKKIQTPSIIEYDFLSVLGQIDRALQKVSNLYLKARKNQKPSPFLDHNNYLNISGQGLKSCTAFHSNISKQSSTKQNSNKDSSQAGRQFKSNILYSLSQIEHYFEGKVIRGSKLIFRASQHNFSIKRFHQMCDNIPDTLTLIHNEFDKRIGGYTPVAWTSDKKHWVADKSMKSFIFSIDMNQKFKLNLAQFAIASNPQRGPIFGCCDICIVDNSQKQKSNCQFPISYNNNGKYTRGQNTSNIFTGHLKGQFLIKEWQVYRLDFQ